MLPWAWGSWTKCLGRTLSRFKRQVAIPLEPWRLGKRGLIWCTGVLSTTRSAHCRVDGRRHGCAAGPVVTRMRRPTPSGTSDPRLHLQLEMGSSSDPIGRHCRSRSLPAHLCAGPVSSSSRRTRLCELMADQADEIAFAVADEGHPLVGPGRPERVVVVMEDHMRSRVDLHASGSEPFDLGADIGDL